jgi:hypothetical protein
MKKLTVVQKATLAKMCDDERYNAIELQCSIATLLVLEMNGLIERIETPGGGWDPRNGLLWKKKQGVVYEKTVADN